MRLYQIPPELNGKRLDQALAEILPELSRSRIQQRLKDGQILVDEQILRPKHQVHGGETVQVFDPLRAPAEDISAKPIPLPIVFEDEELLVINKPVGLVVHPGAGNPDGTLLNGLLHYRPRQSQLSRGGIVHRLDKDTSGLLVVAATEAAHKSLVAQLAARTIQRNYLALVRGQVISGGVIEQAIGRHPQERTRMAVMASGRAAITHYRIAEKFRRHTLLDVRLETGRTHQIRVHFAHLHHPIVGDQTYGQRSALVAGSSERVRDALQNFRHQALHAARLTVEHPTTGQPMTWEAPLPADFAELLQLLREDLHA